MNEIKIERNPDILDFLGKNNRYNPKLLVGFAAQTEDLIPKHNSQLKIISSMEYKKLPLKMKMFKKN